MRLLPIFQIFNRTLGLRESPSGLVESQATEATSNISNLQRDTGPLGKSQWPGRVPGHWGYCQYLKFSKGHWAFGKVPVARQSPGSLRPLTFLGVTGSLGLRESPGGPAKSWVTEATDISRGHQVTGPSGKSRWPGKVLGHWGHWHLSGSPGHWAFGKVPVARQSPGSLRPLTFLGVTGSLGLRESPGGLAKSWVTEATAFCIQKYMWF